MSFPPITDSGIFKRLVQSSKGGANTGKLSKVGMTTPQVCEFIGDSLVRTLPHYLPLLNHKACPEVFDTTNPLLFWHLLPPQLLAADGANQDDGGETPAALLANILGLAVDQISDNALITSYGLDSLAGESSSVKFAYTQPNNFRYSYSSQFSIEGCVRCQCQSDRTSRFNDHRHARRACVQVEVF